MKEAIKKNRAAFALAMVLSVLGIVYISSLKPVVNGDGREYMMQIIAFQNHFSFGVTRDDMEQAKEEFFLEGVEIEDTWENHSGLMHTFKDAKYSNHYGMYCALVVPVKIITDLLGLYPTWAMYITNLLLYIAAMLVVVFCLRIENHRKLIIVLLTAINPAVLYLGWTHTEVYIYTFVVIGLVFYYNNSFALAIFFLSVAAMQNLSVLVFAMAVGLELIFLWTVRHIKERDRYTPRQHLLDFVKTILPYGLCYIPGLIPLMSTYLRFRVFNHVANISRENKYLIHKAIDYLFDPNLGIFPYEPFLLCLFLIVCIIGLKKNTEKTIFNLLGIGGVLYIVSNQIQINSGMNCIMRYNVWIIPMMMFFVICTWDKLFTNGGILLIVGVFETLWTGGLLCFLLLFGGLYENTQFAPWTKLILDKTPVIYNPTHGIFYSRTLGKEVYDWPVPVVYRENNGSIRKVLCNKASKDLFYSDEWILWDAKGNDLSKADLHTHKVDEGDYIYIDFSDEAYHGTLYEPGDVIWFYTEAYNADDYVVGGLSYKEDWGSWTDGDEAVIWLFLKDQIGTFHCHIDVAGAFYHPQTVQILADNEMVYSGLIEGDDGDVDFDFSRVSGGPLQIKIKIPDSVRPSDVVDSSDTRDLGIGLKSMTVTEIN